MQLNILTTSNPWEKFDTTMSQLRSLHEHPSGRHNREIGEKCSVNNAISASAELIQEPRFESAIISTPWQIWWSEWIQEISAILSQSPAQPCVVFVEPWRDSLDTYITRHPSISTIIHYPNVRIATLPGIPIMGLFWWIWENEWDHRYFRDGSNIDKNTVLSSLDHGWWQIERHSLSDDDLTHNDIVKSLIQRARNAGIQGTDRDIVRQIIARKSDESRDSAEVEIPQHGTLNTVCVDWDGTLFWEIRNGDPVNTDLLEEAIELAKENWISVSLYTGGGWDTIQTIYSHPSMQPYFQKYPHLHVMRKSDCRGWEIPVVYDDSSSEELNETYEITVREHKNLGDIHWQVARNIERQRQSIAWILNT